MISSSPAAQTPTPPAQELLPGAAFEQGAIPKRFYSLDALRGIAALTVILSHWQFFFFTGTTPPPQPDPGYAFYAWLHPFYNHGHRAVELFFSLSGFIFFWLYSKRILSGKIGIREFSSLRFSRLYPLHFVTLLAVCGLQLAIRAQQGSFLITPNNDPYHFILHLFFISNWGFEKGFPFSFNTPIWSVSVEIFLYGVFFVACLCRSTRWWQLLAFATFGYWLHGTHFEQVGRGLLSFFLGGIAFQIFTVIQSRQLFRSAKLPLLILVSAWMLVPLNQEHQFLYRTMRLVLGDHGLMAFHGFLNTAISRITDYSYELILFPVTIIALALTETFIKNFGRRLSFLGDISYSSYLLHMPIMLSVIYFATALGIDHSVYYSPWAVLALFSVIIPAAWTSYHYFELPAQRFLRDRLLRKGSRA